jgi:hypothetical protein
MNYQKKTTALLPPNQTITNLFRFIKIAFTFVSSKDLQSKPTNDSYHTYLRRTAIFEQTNKGVVKALIREGAVGARMSAGCLMSDSKHRTSSSVVGSSD